MEVERQLKKQNAQIIKKAHYEAGASIHSILSLIAIFMSIKCNGGIEVSAVLAACCCPYIYIPYALVIHGKKCWTFT